MPALRHADPPGVVHEPLQLQLPDAASRAPDAAAGARREHDGAWSPSCPATCRASGYRWFVRGLGRGAGLAGSARNLPDGRVEVVLEGAGRRRRRRRSPRWTGRGAPGTRARVDARHEPVQGSRRLHHGSDECDITPTRGVVQSSR